MLRTILTTSSIVISLAMYVPLWARIIRRGSSSDYSKLSYCGILALQVIHLTLAWLAWAPFLIFIYCVHTVLVTVTMMLIWRYYKHSS